MTSGKRILKMWPRFSNFRVGPGNFPFLLLFWLAPMMSSRLKFASSGYVRKSWPPKLAEAHSAGQQYWQMPISVAAHLLVSPVVPMTSQCLCDRHIGELVPLQSEIRHWSEQTNANQCGVDWQFHIDDARQKLKRLYPQLKT